MPPVYADDQLEVYAVPPAPQTAPYLVLGDSWYPVEPPDQHRWLKGQTATLQIENVAIKISERALGRELACPY